MNLNLFQGHFFIKYKLSSIIISSVSKNLHKNGLIPENWSYTISSQNLPPKMHEFWQKLMKVEQKLYLRSISGDAKIIWNGPSNIFIVHLHVYKDKLRMHKHIISIDVVICFLEVICCNCKSSADKISYKQYPRCYQSHSTQAIEYF